MPKKTLGFVWTNNYRRNAHTTLKSEPIFIYMYIECTANYFLELNISRSTYLKLSSKVFLLLFQFTLFNLL